MLDKQLKSHSLLYPVTNKLATKIFQDIMSANIDTVESKMNAAAQTYCPSEKTKETIGTKGPKSTRIAYVPRKKQSPVAPTEAVSEDNVSLSDADSLGVKTYLALRFFFKMLTWLYNRFCFDNHPELFARLSKAGYGRALGRLNRLVNEYLVGLKESSDPVEAAAGKFILERSCKTIHKNYKELIAGSQHRFFCMLVDYLTLDWSCNKPDCKVCSSTGKRKARKHPALLSGDSFYVVVDGKEVYSDRLSDIAEYVSNELLEIISGFEDPDLFTKAFANADSAHKPAPVYTAPITPQYNYAQMAATQPPAQVHVFVRQTPTGPILVDALGRRVVLNQYNQFQGQ